MSNSCMPGVPSSFVALGWWTCRIQQRVSRLFFMTSKHLRSRGACAMQVNGDMNAYLYTSSRAMHSEILNLLLPQASSPNFSVAADLSHVHNLYAYCAPEMHSVYQ